MNAKEKEVTQEVERFVRDLVVERVNFEIAWVAEQLLARHPDIHGADAEFHAVFSRRGMDDYVDRVLRRCTIKDVEVTGVAKQLLLGFETLPVTVRIDGRGVPIEDMTIDLIDKKIAEHDSMATGNSRAADEWRRYRAALVEQQGRAA